MADEPIVLKYQPKNPGDGFVDVPRRDLTQSDVDALVGAALRNVLHPAGEPIYVPVEHKSAEGLAKKAAANTAPDDKKGGE